MQDNRIRITPVLIAVALAATPFILTREARAWSLAALFTGDRIQREEREPADGALEDRNIHYLPPLEGKDLFAAMADLSICRRQEVRKHIYLYLTVKRDYLIRAIARSRRYDEAIRAAFRGSPDLPEDLALLPMLESCYSPFAVSRSRAVGLWQFVDNTARPLGLRTNRWIDERRSVEKSTAAAIRHLRNIRKCFPDWELTLAAYNGGAGYVARAMQATGCRDFWKLRESGRLREETSEYVPKFIALCLIHNNQRLFGVHDEVEAPKRLEVEYLPLRRPVDLRAVARIAGLSVREIIELNPELSGTATPPDIVPYPLALPKEGYERLRAFESKLYQEPARMTGLSRRNATLSAHAEQKKKNYSTPLSRGRQRPIRR